MGVRESSPDNCSNVLMLQDDRSNDFKAPGYRMMSIPIVVETL
jgi:hypothetical protein